MLFVQCVSLWYRKDVRYANYANARNAIKFMPINIDNLPDCEVVYQQVNLYQNVNGIEKTYEKINYYNEEIFTYGKRDTWYNRQNLIHNIRILNNNYDIVFCNDDYHRAFNTIKRKGHNNFYHDRKSPFAFVDVTNEKVFTVENGKYGRIIYNDRVVSCYSEKWYYITNIVNFVNCDKNKFREKIFYKKNPDYKYENMQYLKYC